ncbi:MAG: toxin-antitoxin system HicB family antitoxin [Clostridium sp.]|uniref:toxin-antitoxin system HicB family antitoxin n=1 Tax=Clostridium sp. TaxID=1506 RepID=UPI002914720B|nr:toxin-antitoxin system HicB family antitoxin [Clostridium sp.]MDU4320569.1 toxin-antitoxin system HicB family antitoxin [Clostridium sp.]
MRRIEAEDYKIEVMKDTDSGEGYLAYIPQLDCWGDGNTAEEAYKDVVSVANDVLEMARLDNVPIPKPTVCIEEKYSGKISLRLPKFLHGEIAKRAEKEGCSINQLIQAFISMGIGMKYGQEQEKSITINIQGATQKIQERLNKEYMNELGNKEESSAWINEMYQKLGTKDNNFLA